MAYSTMDMWEFLDDHPESANDILPLDPRTLIGHPHRRLDEEYLYGAFMFEILLPGNWTLEIDGHAEVMYAVWNTRHEPLSGKEYMVGMVMLNRLLTVARIWQLFRDIRWVGLYECTCTDEQHRRDIEDPLKSAAYDRTRNPQSYTSKDYYGPRMQFGLPPSHKVAAP